MPEQLTERARLEAGGLVLVGAKVGADLATDTVDARGYTSPVLPGRTVVRLVPDAIARGIDTEMELLGFAMTSHTDDIATQRRRALGFPGATLVLDPERARYALDVMREFKKHAKRIASKPGHAKEGFDEIGERLSRQVPHFLPSYYEEVARAFAHGGNLTYAGTFFDKARTAEREFGLEVDEERRAEAFLEFALLGALTVKSIQAYGKEVQRLAGAEKGYERLLQLATRRTLGGVAPWASLPKDLRALAKAAKRDLAREDAAFLREVSSAAALKRAPSSFWSEYRDAWTAVAKAEPAVRGRLLDLFPNGGKARYSWREDTSGFTDEWLELLHACGALDALWDEVPEGARPNGSRAAWFHRLQEWAGPGDGFVLQLVRKAAPTLRRDGIPLVVHGGDWYRPLDVDLVDLVIELGLPWVIKEGWRRVDLAKWAGWKPAPARAGLPAEVRPRDPVHAAADPSMVEVLRPAIDVVFGNPQFEAVAAGMAGMKALRAQWLRDRLGELSGPGLAATATALDRLEGATSADHFAEFPEAVDALRAADVGASLGATLRAGLMEELCWPAWEQARGLLGLDKPVAQSNEHGLRVQWPYVLWFTARRLVVLDQERVLATLDLKHGDGKALPDLAWYVGGKVLVGFHYWAKGGSVNVAYWSDAPNDTFEVPQRWHRDQASFPVNHPDAIVVGAERFTAGDRGAPDAGAQYHDADTSWVVVDGRLRVQDRATGAPGPEGSPGFLRGVTTTASYFPVPGRAATTSPVVGVVDGQYGSRHVTPRAARDEDEDEDGDADERVTAPTLLTLAGDRFVGTVLAGTQELGALQLLRFPGRSGTRAVAQDSGWRSGKRVNRTLLTAPDARAAALAIDGADQLLPPLVAWHFLVPRDAAASRALAALTDDDARALLAVDPAGTAPGALVAGVTEPEIHRGLAAQVALARACADRWRKLVDARTSGGVVRARPTEKISDEELAPALQNLRNYWTYGGLAFSHAVETLGRFLRDGETGETVTYSRLAPPEWIGHLRGIAVNAARPGLAPEHRDVLAKALRLFVGAGLAGAAVRAGVVEFSRKDLPWVVLVDDDDGGKKPGAAWRHHERAHRLFVSEVSEVGDDDTDGPWKGSFVQHVTEGELPTPTGATLSEVRTNAAGDAEWVLAFLDALAARGPYPVTRADAERLAEATGLTVTDAAVVLLGFPIEVDKEVREGLGLKHADVKAACLRLRGRPFDEKVALLGARGAATADDVWGPAAVDGVIAAYAARHGRRVALDEALLLAADKELGRGGAAQVQQVVNHAGWKALHEDAVFRVDPTGNPVTDGDEGFTSGVALQVARAVCWLAGRLPVGHPVRAALPEVVAASRARLASPGLWFSGPRWYHYEERPAAAAKKWFDALPGRAIESVTTDGGEVTTWQKSVGAVAVTRTAHFTRTAVQLTSLDDAGRELLVTLARMAEQDVDTLWPIEVLRSPGMTALVERLGSTPVPAGGWEQNPLASAPELVKVVTKKKKLSADAAAAWLQLLALVEPSKKAVCEWNGWSPKTYDAAMAELTAAGLVVEGKRARSGREHFLPGGWVDAKVGPPYELWKQPLYGMDPKSERFPLDRMVPLVPHHALFAAAWERCERGDAPAFEEVRR
jgi:hypothetical protein